MSQSLQYTVPIQCGHTPIDALLRESGISAAVLKEAAIKGAVWISQARKQSPLMRNSRLARLRALDQPLAHDSIVYLNYNQAVLAQQPQSISCIADHVNYGFWDKPAGMLCQGSKWSDHTTATQVASTQLGKPCFLVHRLDKAASGLLLIAYTKNATRQLSELFQQRKITKRYTVKVNGLFDKPLPWMIDLPVEGKPAQTEILGADCDKKSNSSTLMVSISTGRKHQIRQHLADQNYPVVGDRLYAPGIQHNQDLQLRACALSFICPFTNKPVGASLI